MEGKDKSLIFTDEEALRFHQEGRAGKIEIIATKPVLTQRDLSLAYSPGVAVPVRAIAENPDKIFDYTARGNLVAVISNGTAILGLGNLGAGASKPVMEGKAVLFKRFAGIDAIDLEIDTENCEEFINSVRFLSKTFGGINLEDIKAPDCFIIEKRLCELMDIPVFHDDQHGTAIIFAAGLINAIHLTERNFETSRLIINGAGAAGIACAELSLALGIKKENIITADRLGPICKGRNERMNEWKEKFASDTKFSTLEEAANGADIILGLSEQGAFSSKMIANLAPNPIIFALANPDPEITPEEVAGIRSDAIMATGRSDYPNQVNNVLGFPYIFRGALDVRAKEINQEMKIAAAYALAELARADVPDEVARAYQGTRLHFGKNYIIPAPFDPRLIHTIPPAVAQAAITSGAARAPIVDIESYREHLTSLQNPIASNFQNIMRYVREHPKRVIFSEGEEEQVIRAALTYREMGLGEPILIGRKIDVERTMKQIDLPNTESLIVEENTPHHPNAKNYAAYLYERLQRKGLLERDCVRLLYDRNILSACKLVLGEADAMVTGRTRNYNVAMNDVLRVINPRTDRTIIGLSMLLASDGRTIFIADTSIHEMPNAEEIANISIEAARTVRRLGYEPRVAFLAYANFGYGQDERSTQMRGAVEILDRQGVDFEYEGELAANIALNTESNSIYRFNRLTAPANILIMPAIHSASISTKMLEELGKSTLIGPMLVGLEHSVQIMQMTRSTSDLVNMAALAAFDLNR